MAGSRHARVQVGMCSRKEVEVVPETKTGRVAAGEWMNCGKEEGGNAPPVRGGREKKELSFCILQGQLRDGRKTQATGKRQERADEKVWTWRVGCVVDKGTRPSICEPPYPRYPGLTSGSVVARRRDAQLPN